MATNLKPLPPPLQHPITDQEGKITRPWVDFCNALYRYEYELQDFVDLGVNIYIGPTEPTSPSENDLWVDTS